MQLEKKHGSEEQLDALLKKATTFCPKVLLPTLFRLMILRSVNQRGRVGVPLRPPLGTRRRSEIATCRRRDLCG